MVMNNGTRVRSSLRLSAMLLLAGQVLYIVITLLHTGGNANDHPTIFEAYAESGTWTIVHLGQFAAMAILLAGLFALFFALDAQATLASSARWAGQFGAAFADAEKAARFASAEAIRWIEWGLRSYQNYALGLAVLLFAVAVVRMAGIPRPIAILMALSGLTYLVQGWIAETEGFSPTLSNAIVLAYVLDVVWMLWLVIVALRIQDSQPRRLADEGGSRPDAIAINTSSH
jgi:hypothetical protein